MPVFNARSIPAQVQIATKGPKAANRPGALHHVAPLDHAGETFAAHGHGEVLDPAQLHAFPHILLCSRNLGHGPAKSPSHVKGVIDE